MMMMMMIMKMMIMIMSTIPEPTTNEQCHIYVVQLHYNGLPREITGSFIRLPSADEIRIIIHFIEPS